MKCFKFAILLQVIFTVNFVRANFLLSKAVNDFSVDLYSSVAQKSDENIVISPLSVQIALTMAMFGANGPTSEDLKKGLRFNEMTTDQVSENFKQLIEEYNHSPQVKLANRIFYNDGTIRLSNTEKVKMKPEFKEIIEKKFASEIQGINFRDRQESAELINKWVAENTNNLIENFIDKYSYFRNVSLMIVNTIHFHGNWLYPFNKTLTKKGDFHLDIHDTTNKVETDFMVLNDNEFNYTIGPEFQMIELPYEESSGMSLLILLPHWKVNLSDLEKNLNSTYLQKEIESMEESPVNIELPKFTINFDVDLKDSFDSIGMGSVLHGGAFTNFFESNEKLEISNVFQKALIDVDEVGTKAAAATGISLVSRSTPEKFEANRPFLFILKSKTHFLFMGRFVKP